MKLTLYIILCYQILTVLSSDQEDSCPNPGYKEPKFLSYLCPSNNEFDDFKIVGDILVAADCRLVNPCTRIVEQNNDLPISEVDFIVVGGGASGPVIASRLSENKDWSVTLLEAGPDHPAAIDIPALLSSALNSDYDWKYKTTKQKNACLINNGICDWPRGKLLGGTAALSGSMYSRGDRKIYDQWLKEGNANWGYDDVLPFFKMSERNLDYDDKYHGKEGPIPVECPKYTNRISNIILKAAKEIGYEHIDMSTESPHGFSLAQVMMENNTRVTIPTAYLRPHLHRGNLDVRVKRYVTRLLVHAENKTVYGVEYISPSNQKFKLIARKEVILAAGVIGSPHLLMLSGIGPKEDLEPLGIPVIKNLSVGHNLQHHVSVGITLKLNVTNNHVPSYKSMLQYITNRTGIMSTTGALQISALINSEVINATDPADLQLFFDGFVPMCKNINTKVGCEKPLEKATLTVRTVNLLPKSRGTIKINSSNPLGRPIIDPNYLSVDQDIDVLLSSLDLVRKLLKANAMQELGPQLEYSKTPECEKYNNRTRNYWECYIKYFTSGENHHAGTCKMGPSSDPDAVVDDHLRVHGVKGIRVADASIMPLQPNCNPIAPTIMIAEKAADYITKTWNKIENLLF